MRAVGIRVGVVGLGYWGTKHVRVVRSTTGVAGVIGIDQRFAQIGDCREGPEYGITAYADIEDALPHVLIEKPMATTTEHNAAVHKLRDLVHGDHLARPTRADHRTGRIDWPT